MYIPRLAICLILIISVQSVDIIKPSVDRGIQFKYLQLQNELKVLLIHDPNTDMANAALDVQAGSWNEPTEYPGLAHLCEHMLFIGSRKYPRAEYFDDILAKGSGSSNAYTDSTNTNYYFEISEPLGKALDVFAHFFIDPLFNPELVDREKNAVNSEYEIDVSAEEWKVQNLLTLLAKSDHPASRFSIGNTNSLNKAGIAEALKKFHNEYYSSNLMSLVVKSRLTVKEMEDLIKPFNKIENKQLKKEQIGKPYQFGLLGKYKTEKPQVILTWQLSGREQFSHEKPIELIDYFLKNGNLFDYIKEKQLIIDYQTQVFSEESSYVNYMIEFTLDAATDSQVAIQLSQIVNNYIQQLEEWLNDDEFLKEIYNEQSKISQINFDYMDEQLDVSTLAKNLNQKPAAEVLSSEFIIDKLNKNLILQYCNELKDPNNLLILVGNNDFIYSREEATNNKQFLKSNALNIKNKLYRVEFATQKLDQHSIKEITKSDHALKSNFIKPSKNEFIPTNLNMISLCKSSGKLPKIVHADKLKTLDHEGRLNLFLMSGQELQKLPNDQCQEKEQFYQKYNHYPLLLNKESQFWWKSATSYKLPTIFGAVQFSNHHLNLREKTSLKLYNFLADEQLAKELKQPLSSGYSYDLEMNKGMEIKIYGFSEHIRNFFKKICSCMNPFKDRSKSFLEITDSNNFNQAKQSLAASIKEIYQQKLFEQAVQVYLPSILRQDYEPEQMLKQIEKISESEMIEDVRKVLNHAKSSSLFVGNLDVEEANSLNEEVRKCQQTDPNQHHSIFKIANIHKANLIYAKYIDQDDTNGVTLNYYQIGKRTSQNYVYMKLLQPILNQQAYNYLRTDLQLGYVVAAQFKSYGCIDGAMILVQGNAESPMKVNQLIDTFTDQFLEYLHAMTKREYEHLKHSVAIELREKPQALIEEGERLWNHIKVGDIEFEEKIIAAESLTTTTKQQLIEFYQSVFQTNRSKLSLQLYGKALDPEIDQHEFNEYIKNTLPKDATIYSNHEQQYHECYSEVTQI